MGELDIMRALQTATSRAQRAAEMKAENDGITSLDEMILTYVRAVLAIFDGNKTRCAKALGIDRRALYRLCAKIEKWEAKTAAQTAVAA